MFGVLLGIPTLRLKDDYLAIVTLGFGIIVVIIALNIDYIGGPDGIYGIPGPLIFGMKIKTKTEFAIFGWLLVALTAFVLFRIKKSRVGRALAAIRDDDLTAQVMGINTTRYKVMAFGLGSAFAGMAGSLYSSYIHYIQPHVFGLHESILILCMLVLGGIGSIPGSMIGAALLALLPELLKEVMQFLPEITTLNTNALQNGIYGLILVLLLIVRPQGIMGKYKIGRDFTVSQKIKGKRA
jgi:branched-chain amino acid transport system permease protein